MNFPGATFSLIENGYWRRGTATACGVRRTSSLRATSCGPNTSRIAVRPVDPDDTPAEMFDVRDVTATDPRCPEPRQPQDGSPGKRHPLAENMEMV